MHRKSTKIWIVLIVAPIVIVILSVFLQVAVRASGIEGDGITVVINLFSLLVGIVAVLGLMGLPVWIVLLLLAISHNKKIDSSISPGNPYNNQTVENPQPFQPSTATATQESSDPTNSL